MANRVKEFGPDVQKRLAPAFRRIGVAYPPETVILVGLKKEKILEVWVSNPPRLLKSYPILKASGTIGPKLREGDKQVPEGLYRVESLNPNSKYHIALRLNYPNAFDRKKSLLDGRDNPGSDIMIHGRDRSIGCLAMGDETAEDLFVLAAEAGVDNVSVILSPTDFRVSDPPEPAPDAPAWTSELYESISLELKKLTNAGE